MSSDSPSPTPSNPTPVEQLLPFTGYYPLKGGNFLLIDTNLTYKFENVGSPHSSLAATITFHGDDEASSVYDFEAFGTFENDQLTVTYENRKVIDVRLYKDSGNGNISTLNGTIADKKRSGVTPFSPIHLPVFAATYFELGLVPQPRLIIGSDHSLWYYEDGRSEPVRIKEYVYNYAMFVIGFTLNGEPYTFEMGTTKGFGRVAGNAAKGGLLVSVPYANYYPPPPPTTTTVTTQTTVTTITTTTTTTMTM